MVMMMWWSNLLNSAFVQSIIKAVLGALVLFGLVKSIRKDAADDKENEVKLDQAEKALDSLVEFTELEDKVHAEVNAHESEGVTDNALRAKGWMRQDSD